MYILLRVGLNEIEMLPYIIRYNFVYIKRHTEILHFDWYGLKFFSHRSRVRCGERQQLDTHKHDKN